MVMTPEQRERWRSTILPNPATESTDPAADGTVGNFPAGGSFRLPRQRSNSFSAGASMASRRSSVPTLALGTFLAGLSEIAATASSPSCIAGSAILEAASTGHNSAAATTTEEPHSLASQQQVGRSHPIRCSHTSAPAAPPTAAASTFGVAKPPPPSAADRIPSRLLH